MHIGDGICGRVAVSRRPELVSGPASAAHFPGLPDKTRAPNSAMSVPMIDRGELVGILNVGASDRRVFTSDDLDLLCGFGELAATSIAKARLYEAARRATAELAYSATHDGLTSLANRTLLAQRIGDAIRDDPGMRPRGALLFIDIDNFKTVNDEHGHGGGDDVLGVISGRLRRTCPTGGTAARVGGDELAMWVPDVVDETEAEAIAARMVEAARQPMLIDGEETYVTVSVGVALAGRHGDNYAELMSAADSALYAAKRAGKDCWRLTSVELDDIPRPRAARSGAKGDAHVAH
jgi:diguanylate cyclase (GGDEF)-like protein